ncbi:MAG: MBL fold metallo-hydrolase [Vicinamibacterales bacterium]
MKALLAIGVAVGTVTALTATALTAQQPATAPRGTFESHIAAARIAAGSDENGMFRRLCEAVIAAPVTPPAPPAAPAAPGAGRGNAPRPVPDRATWHAEPAKVFDNLYFFGQTEFSVWAVTTSEGIVVVDTIFDYSVEDEVVEGMKKLGLDPTQIKYAIVSHGHADHSGGAKFLQDRFGTRILASAADWDLLERSNGVVPKRDMVVTDGQKLTVGDTTFTMYLTPGHTAGTISTVFPVRDGRQSHRAAVWGGTMYNWLNNNGRGYVTPATPTAYWFKLYSDSASRFRDVVTAADVDVLLSNHTEFDGSKRKLPALAARRAGQPHPYVVGVEAVARYLTLVGECATAGSVKFSPAQ